MLVLIVILILIACIILGFIVLIQNSKGGGLASNFAASNQVMGVRKTTDFLEKATWGIASFIIVMCIIFAFITKSEFQAKRSFDNYQTEATSPDSQPVEDID